MIKMFLNLTNESSVCLLGVSNSAGRIVKKYYDKSENKSFKTGVIIDAKISVAESVFNAGIGLVANIEKPNFEDYGEIYRQYPQEFQSFFNQNIKHLVVVSCLGGQTSVDLPVLIDKIIEDNPEVKISAILQTPLRFEGSKSRERSQNVISALKDKVTDLTVLSLEDIANKSGNVNMMTMSQGFRQQDDNIIQIIDKYING